MLADQYFETAFANQDQAIKIAAKVLHEGQLLSQYQTGLRYPVGEKAMSRDPKTFADAIDIAVQEMENQKIREQKIGTMRSATDEAVIRKMETNTTSAISRIRGDS